MIGCPSHDQLARLLREELSGAELSAVQAHVDGCPSCQQSLEALTDSGFRRAASVVNSSTSVAEVARSSSGDGQQTPDDALTPRPEFLERLVAQRPGSDSE